ncbi:hypothetical protein LCGC14_0993220 [marine sediment metagenome]|uniref:DinB family protein n=2 Tax=root TaxID=1 RepID=A0A831VLB2_9FLAO|nr:DinB family protein [Pricia sp.]HEA19500.1 DinB family protein [Pricia antarctica]
MDTAKSKKLEIVIPAYRMHSQNFKNVLEGITEEAALKRIDNNTNHVVWMVGNFINCRYWIGSMLGIEDKNPFDDLFKDARALDESCSYPTLQELKKNFNDISPKVYQKLVNAIDGQLDEKFSFGMNVFFVPETILNMIGMCIGREDYLLGQMGLMRKLLGLKGMGYDMDENLKY